jgi:hypothetical protein
MASTDRKRTSVNIVRHRRRSIRFTPFRTARLQTGRFTFSTMNAQFCRKRCQVAEPFFTLNSRCRKGNAGRPPGERPSKLEAPDYGSGEPGQFMSSILIDSSRDHSTNLTGGNTNGVGGHGGNLGDAPLMTAAVAMAVTVMALSRAGAKVLWDLDSLGASPRRRWSATSRRGMPTSMLSLRIIYVGRKSAPLKKSRKNLPRPAPPMVPTTAICECSSLNATGSQLTPQRGRPPPQTPGARKRSRRPVLVALSGDNGGFSLLVRICEQD